MMLSVKRLLPLFICMTALNACERAPSGSEAQQPTPTIGEETGSIDVWLERLEVGSRELYAAREAVAAAVGVEDGALIADIGAGTGLYTLLFADIVGPAGHVYAVDIEPLFLDLINQRTEDAGFENVTAVFGRENDITLPENSVDIAFIADTYHYFSDREAVMKSVYSALKPGGALIMIEYDIEPGAERPKNKSHVRFGKAGVVAEVEFIGFEKAAEIEIEGLVDNYFIRFVKP